MSLVNDLDELKTSFWGYDKESVHHLFNQYMGEQEKLKKQEMETLLTQNLQYQQEIKGLQGRLKASKEQNDQLKDQYNKVVEALADGRKYSEERDQKMEEYYQKKDDIDRIADRVRKEAEENIRGLLKEAGSQAEEIRLKASADAADMIEKAKDSSKRIFTELLGKSDQICRAMKELQRNMVPAFEWMDQINMSGLLKMQEEMDPDKKKDPAPKVCEILNEGTDAKPEESSDEVEGFKPEEQFSDEWHGKEETSSPAAQIEEEVK